jgi:2-polyprenyl-3-methyl-5-hydroxy-6-metoxy-1,4-benzoquinol methylase
VSTATTIDTRIETIEIPDTSADALTERLFNAHIAAMELISVYVGDTLGLYRALHDGGPATPPELAARAGTDLRYTREWLEQQAVAGILIVDGDPATTDPDGRRFQLPEGHAATLCDAESLNYMAPVATGTVAVAQTLPAVLEGFRTGVGVPYEAYGKELRDFIAAINRPMFLNLLASWVAAVPDVDARLQADPPARVADVGCGEGWSSIALARAYPNIEVHGLDLDDGSIAQARQNLSGTAEADRVRFEVRNAADPRLSGRFDLVTAFETIHDMADPVGALRAMRALLAPGGVVIVADERVAEEFYAPGDEIERFHYSWSAVHCLAVGLADTPSAGTGTVMRPSTLRAYARDAGFQDVEILPVEHDFWRFYRLY